MENENESVNNFILSVYSLIRPETGRHKGLPYTMVKAVPVDLFPGTNHCELIILFTHNTEESTRLNEAPTEGCEQQIVTSLGEQTESLPPSEQVESATGEISDKNCNSNVTTDECVDESNELPQISAPNKTEDLPD